MLVEGRLSIRSYDDTKLRTKAGQPIRRQATEVVISGMQMLSSRRDDGDSGDAGGYNGGRSTAAVGAPARATDSSADEFDNEIPF